MEGTLTRGGGRSSVRPDLDREVGVIGAELLGAVTRRQNAQTHFRSQPASIRAWVTQRSRDITTTLPRGDHASASDARG
jgi:hypothetical protein